jgi:acylphosphatase
MARQQRIVLYKGNVQGVGFRYTAVRIAEEFDVTGYVRNLPDGDVEIVVEGEGQEIDQFLAELSGRFDGFIRKQTQQIAPPGGQFRTFTVGW